MAEAMNGKYYWNNVALLKELKLGDLLEFPRGSYSHWAVYAGNESVIHLAGDDNDGLNANINPKYLLTIFGEKFSKAEARKESFWKVAQDSKVIKNNSRDSDWRPYSPDKIVFRASSFLGNVGYNVMFGNCEHFAKWCRYGKWNSDQVDEVLADITDFGASIVAGATSALVKK